MKLFIENVDISNGLLDIYIESDENIAGFQFELLGVAVTDAVGGLAELHEFVLSTSPSMILGFSMTGTYIPAGSGLLTQITFSNYLNNGICFGTSSITNVVSNIFGNILQTDWGDCVEPMLLGDLNNDGNLDILDLVVLSNMILLDSFTSYGDMNQDGQLNILDIVNLVNTILSA